MEQYKKRVEAMERLEAQEILTQLKVMDYPNMKDDARTKLHKNLSSKAFPNVKKKIHSFDDIEKVLGL